MSETAPIQYRGFYDRPLAFVVEYRNQKLLFWLNFNDFEDSYENEYQVFVLRGSTLQEEFEKASWEHLPQQSIKCMRAVPTQDVKFDKTRRKEINVDVLISLFNQQSLADS